MGVPPFSEQVVSELLHNCTSCGGCVKVCPFLQKFGNPKEIILNQREEIFYCTNCGACNKVCPEKIKPSYALLLTKSKLLEKNTPLGKKLQNRALKYVQRGHSFPFSHWERVEIALWPGCSLAGTSPLAVTVLLKFLKREFPKNKVGLILDCCFDPLYQIGDFNRVIQIWEDFKQRFDYFRIKRVITGCFNCYKIFCSYSKNIEVNHLLEVLSVEAFKNLPETFFVHLPCPVFEYEELREVLMGRFQGDRVRVLNLPSCCGAGGGAYSNQEIALSFLKNALQKAKANQIVTFCMGCKNRFLKANTQARHILEFIPEIKAIDKPVSSFRKWINRFLLSIRAKLFNIKGLFLIFLLVLIVLHLNNNFLISSIRLEDLRKLIISFSHNPLSLLLYLVVYALAPSLFISSLGLTILAGFLWGPFLGTLIALTGATLGATVSFLLSRYLLRDSLYVRFGALRWKYIQEKTQKHGWKALAFARLFPLFPFPVVNYLFGLTPLSLKVYLITTFVFMMPAGFAYTYLGHSLQELLLKKNFIPLILVLMLLMGLSIIMKFISKKWKP